MAGTAAWNLLETIHTPAVAPTQCGSLTEGSGCLGTHAQMWRVLTSASQKRLRRTMLGVHACERATAVTALWRADSDTSQNPEPPEASLSARPVRFVGFISVT